MSRKNIILVVLVVVLGAMGVGYYALSGTGGGGASDDGRAGYTLVATDRGMGNPKAPVTVIEYGAPSCSICAYFTANIFPDLKKNYIDTGKVYYVFRVFPLRPEDGDVEKMARCLPEDKYFPFLDLFWRNQPKWDAAEYPGITAWRNDQAGTDCGPEFRTDATMHRQQGGRCPDQQSRGGGGGQVPYQRHPHFHHRRDAAAVRRASL